MNAPTSSASRLLRSARSRSRAEKSAAGNAIRVMVIDDSLTVRTVLKRIVESDEAMVVAESASSAESGLIQLKRNPVDIVLLDLEMPGMGGLEALPAILEAAPSAQVMVVSSLTKVGAEATIEALAQGAADTMLKPRPGGFNEEYRSLLLDKIRALGGSETEESDNAAAAEKSANRKGKFTKAPEVLAIGASTGGIHGLNLLLRGLSPDFDLPIVITQHLPISFIPVFARQVEAASGRPTHIAEDGTEIRKGEIAIATGHGHMVVRRIAGRLVARVLAEPAPSGCLPSVDPMLASLAATCKGRVLAVILSGMGRDGCDGAEALVDAGGTVWAQDAETSAVWGMPGAVTKAGLASLVAPPQAIAAELSSHLCAPGSDAAPCEAAAETQA